MHENYDSSERHWAASRGQLGQSQLDTPCRRFVVASRKHKASVAVVSTSVHLPSVAEGIQLNKRGLAFGVENSQYSAQIIGAFAMLYSIACVRDLCHCVS